MYVANYLETFEAAIERGILSYLTPGKQSSINVNIQSYPSPYTIALPGTGLLSLYQFDQINYNTYLIKTITITTNHQSPSSSSSPSLPITNHQSPSSSSSSS